MEQFRTSCPAWHYGSCGSVGHKFSQQRPPFAPPTSRSTPKTPQCRLQKFFITRPACPHALLSATPDGNIDQLLPQSRPGILTIPVRVSVSTITRAERTGGTSPRERAEPKCQLMHGEQPPFSRPLHGSGKSQSAEDLGMRSSYSYLVLHVLTGLARLGKQVSSH